jgi:succinoglycan biosynthesis protein ExoA
MTSFGTAVPYEDAKAKAENMRLRGPGNVQDATPVLCVVPCLNEAEHLDGLIARLRDEANRVNLKIVVADGGSSDGSRNVVRRHMQDGDRVVLLENAKRIQGAAVNKAVEIYGGAAEFLIRVDAHCSYPAGYCESLLAIQSETGADSVVVSMRAEGDTCFQKAAAAAQNSILGNGGTAHRNAASGRFVDHGHHALIRIAAYKAIGGYDESFSWNEDAEFDVRLRANGFRIFLAGAPSIVYFPRRTIGALFRQYFNHGRGRARNFLKHRERLRLRQVVPLAIAPAVGLSLLAPIVPVFVIPALLWSASCLAYGGYLGVKSRQPCALLSGVCAVAMHSGWSLGFYAWLAIARLRAWTHKPDFNAQARPKGEADEH